jgi:ABC-type cobalamin transport system permease subunit
MIAWALGTIGGSEQRMRYMVLELVPVMRFLHEIERALDSLHHY